MAPGWARTPEVLQRQREPVPAQPEGPCRFWRGASLLDGSSGRPDFASRARHRARIGHGAVAAKPQQPL